MKVLPVDPTILILVPGVIYDHNLLKFNTRSIWASRWGRFENGWYIIKSSKIYDRTV